MRAQTKRGLGDDVDHIQRDTNGKCPAEIRRHMLMPGVRVSNLSVVMRLMIMRVALIPLFISSFHDSIDRRHNSLECIP
jgi:hypothetical protein